ncbi:ParB/RepB/Spo0J family partition protein [Stenotrophomonas maltophilia]|uniref:ParB/RepB/Spo0J family partition protein n=1 Tax=Stenotrophomonas maltophilia TaxID=40324 RepID=UPI00066D13D5|nr:ParB/RepB/Spo0J family partition protein [Stenotrophomonas maltophilia]MDH0793326.1 ParB/RepB/Spo0J family partition protein [Stenotrophomonas maltophilia]
MSKPQKKKSGFAATLAAMGERGLKGFGADSADSFEAVVAAVDEPNGRTYVQAIDVNLIDPSPHQNREIDWDHVASLAMSIEAEGLGDPIRLRPNAEVPGRYLLIAGEHRWRAHVKLGRGTVDSLVLSNVTDEDSAKATLIENLLHKELTPLQTAEGLRTLIDLHKLSYQQVATSLGKSKTWVTSHMGMLKLPPEIQDAVREGKLRDYTVIAGMNKLLEQYPDQVLDALASATSDAPLSRAELSRIERAASESAAAATLVQETSLPQSGDAGAGPATTVPHAAGVGAEGESGARKDSDGVGDSALRSDSGSNLVPSPDANSDAGNSAPAGASGRGGSPAVQPSRKQKASTTLRVVVGLDGSEGPLGLLVMDDQGQHEGHVSVEMPMGEISSFPLADLRILGFSRD